MLDQFRSDRPRIFHLFKETYPLSRLQVSIFFGLIWKNRNPAGFRSTIAIITGRSLFPFTTITGKHWRVADPVRTVTERFDPLHAIQEFRDYLPHRLDGVMHRQDGNDKRFLVGDWTIIVRRRGRRIHNGFSWQRRWRDVINRWSIWFSIITRRRSHRSPARPLRRRQFLLFR